LSTSHTVTFAQQETDSTYGHAEAFTSLKKSEIDDRTQSVLLPTSARGGADTLRQKVKREKVLADAGIDLPEDSRLFRNVMADAPTTSESQDSDVACPIQSGMKPAVVLQARTAVHTAVNQKDLAHPSPTRRPAPDSHSDDDMDQGPKLARDLSKVMPPVAVTFKKKKKGKDQGEDMAKVLGPQERGAVSASAMKRAKLAKATLEGAGEVPSEFHEIACRMFSTASLCAALVPHSISTLEGKTLTCHWPLREYCQTGACMRQSWSPQGLYICRG
jgi:hypothetical protein